MFANHQPRIAAFARENPSNFSRVMCFVVLSIRTRLFNVPADMETLYDQNQTTDDLAGILYGSKGEAIGQIEAEAESLYWQAEEIFYHAKTTRELAENLLNLFVSIHGIGLAKAGFCAQLIYGVSACLDSHNLERFGIPESQIKSSTFKRVKTLKTRWCWIRRYCDLVEKCGGTESLWDSWCAYVHQRPDETGFKMNGNRTVYESAFHVSGLHCESLGLAV